MGSQFSGLDASLKRNQYLNRLVDLEHVDENDPFWNQLLSFALDLPLTKENSKLLDESVAMLCEKFHQNNAKSGNYGALIGHFCRLSVEMKKMSDNCLMALQTGNALLLIRCFTKYIVEIENESALLEQLSFRPAEGLDSKEKEQVNADSAEPSKSAHAAEFSSSSSSSSSPTASPSKAGWHANNRSNNKDRYNYYRDENQFNEDSSLADVESETDTALNNGCENKKKNENILCKLIKHVFALCIEVPVETHTYYMHLEALNTILILLSVQMYTKRPPSESFVFETFLLRMDRYVSEMVKTLLKNIIQQMPAPPMKNLSSYLQDQPRGDAGRSLISSLTSGLWTVMTLGMASSHSSSKSAEANDSDKNASSLTTYLPALPAEYNSSSSSSAYAYDAQSIDCASRLLAWQSCHILLVLVNHCTNESLYNPYRLALFHFTDTQDTPTNLPNSEPLPWFSIEYAKLFQMFTYTLHNDQYTLLIYMLLHRNQHFKMFILSRLNIDLLIVPILKAIFTAPEKNSHHIYMPLIILLILSEDDIFNKTIHNLPLKRLNWYTERSLSEISLGSLLILIVIRTIQFNMTRMRDKYLHTNCLAALANMSSKFNNLHPYVCQRINSLFNMLAKKRAKLIVAINTESGTAETEFNSEITSQEQDLLQDLSIIEELMRMVLEIINSCLINNLHHNAELVYSLLYHKSIYMQFQNHPTFQDVMENIELVITSFSHEIEHLEDKSIEKLKEILELGCKQFHRDRFRKFPDLKFKYVEEDQPEEFFVPYVWSLVYKCSNLYWIDYTAKLFKNNEANSQSETTASSSAPLS